MSTTPEQAKRLVVGSILTTGVLASAREVQRGKAPDIRIVLGVFVSGLMLAALSGPLPAIAGGLAALLGLSALLTIGPEVFGALTKGLNA